MVLALLLCAVKYQIPIGYVPHDSANCRIESGRNSVVFLLEPSKVFALIVLWCRRHCNCDHRRLISMGGSAEIDKRPSVFNASGIGQISDPFLKR